MLAVVAVLALIAIYLVHQKLLSQAKELKTLKNDFNKVLEIVEPIVEGAAEVEEARSSAAQQPQSAPQQQTVSAKPYGWRNTEEAKRAAQQSVQQSVQQQGPARGPGSAVDVPAPAGTAGVSLDALSGGNDYAALF